MRSLILFVAISTWFVGSAGADTILIPVCNTGMTATCSGLNGSPGTPDLNYSLVAVPLAQPFPAVTAVTGPAYVTQNGIYPFDGAWIANGPNSGWIAPTANQGDPVQGGEYIYETMFTLPDLFSNPILAGQWATDNSGSAILLNGHDLGASIPYGPPFGFTYFSAFGASDPTWFLPGVNTLDFVVVNGNGTTDTLGPSGLRVEFTSATYDIAAVPEPSTMGLILLGLPVAWLVKNRRRPR